MMSKKEKVHWPPLKHHVLTKKVHWLPKIMLSKKKKQCHFLDLLQSSLPLCPPSFKTSWFCACSWQIITKVYVKLINSYMDYNTVLVFTFWKSTRKCLCNTCVHIIVLKLIMFKTNTTFWRKYSKSLVIILNNFQYSHKTHFSIHPRF